MKSYYGIVYLKNGDCCICSPCASESEVMEELKKAVKKYFDKVEATSYITREGDPSLKKLFGCPDSRNLMKNKKFLKEL